LPAQSHQCSKQGSQLLDSHSSTVNSLQLCSEHQVQQNSGQQPEYQ
jgi:hypothetical protein